MPKLSDSSWSGKLLLLPLECVNYGREDFKLFSHFCPTCKSPHPHTMGDDMMHIKRLTIITLLLLVQLGSKLANGADVPGDNTHKISAL